jgi:V/A-type H+/Na+-transporting ATPase subunit C
MSAGNESFATYFNARIRGMKSRLLTRAQFDDFLEVGSEQAIVDRLLNSPYSEEMAEALTRASGAQAVEDAASRNLVNTFNKLLRAATDEHYGALAHIFLTRWDLTAVKSLLRMQHHEIDVTDALQELVPGPNLTVPLMEQLANSDSMASLIAGLIRWNSTLCAPLQRVFADYEQERDLAILEEALDRSYFEDNVKRLEQHEDEDTRFVRRVLKMEIDRINLRILFGLRDLEEGAALKFRLLKGGTLRESLLEEMAAAENAESAMELLDQTPYRQLAEGVYELAQSGRFAQIERLFDRQLLHQLRTAARVNVLSIAVFMEYAWLKYNEVVNLRLAARGEERHVPKGRIREEMIYV